MRDLLRSRSLSGRAGDQLTTTVRSPEVHVRPLPRKTRPALRVLVATTIGGVAATIAVSPSAVAAPAAPSTSYRAHDYADGQAMSILPPGENGLVNAADALAAQGGTRPAGSQDQLPKYANLLYGAPTLTNAGLGQYFDDASFGVAPGQITRTETPGPGVTVYRDTH